VTPDFVNPEAPWPNLVDLERRTAATGRQLLERLAIAPAFALRSTDWVDAALRPRVLHAIDARGYVREDRWHAGAALDPPALRAHGRSQLPRASREVADTLARARAGAELSESQIAALFAARGEDLDAVFGAADALRRETNGDRVSYVVNRNINYTNICTYHCGFCAFSKGRGARSLRGPGYLIDGDEIASRTREAWDCDRSAPGWHPSAVHGRDVSRHCRRGQARRARDARARVLAARGHARRANA
jgi:FO synthase